MGETDTFNYRIAQTKVAWESKKAFDAGYRIIVNQGGTRSGKTYSMLDLLIAIAYTSKYSISVVSASFPHLRKGAMRDWRRIMEEKGNYTPSNHIKSEQKYEYPLGGYMEFFSVDDSGKVRGPGRDILFWNEANIGDLDTWQQLIFRTTKCIFIDFNPADEFHWIYDEVLNRDDCYFIQSTYLDNPYLSEAQIKEIERTRDMDSNTWKVYGLGERGSSQAQIYTHWKTYDTVEPDDYCYGLDFGYNNPVAFTKVGMKDKNLYWDELLYQSHLTTPDIIKWYKDNIHDNKPVICDNEPDRIEELKRAGINAIGAIKKVKERIDFVKSRGLFIQKGAVNMLKEIKSYKYKEDANGKVNTDDPVKLNDHAMDSAGMASVYLDRPKRTGKAGWY